MKFEHALSELATLARSDLFKVQASQARGKIDPAIVTRPGHTRILAFLSGLPSLTLTWALHPSQMGRTP
ncbi:MAG: hypothetical protein IIC72_11950 [Acidobacteria bacterium]|nr:hypothetical protein [Acidobacteriota bacterium]